MVISILHYPLVQIFMPRSGLNERGGERQQGRCRWPGHRKTPGRRGTIRVQVITLWAVRKRRFSQVWVECAAAGFRLFLTSAYLSINAWRYPPNLPPLGHKNGGFRFLKSRHFKTGAREVLCCTTAFSFAIVRQIVFLFLAYMLNANFVDFIKI